MALELSFYVVDLINLEKNYNNLVYKYQWKQILVAVKILSFRTKDFVRIYRS